MARNAPRARARDPPRYSRRVFWSSRYSLTALLVLSAAACDIASDDLRPRSREPKRQHRPNVVRYGAGAGQGGAGGADGALPEGGREEAGASSAGGGGGAGEGGSSEVFRCAPGALVVIASEGCEQVGICQASGDRVEPLPCEEGDLLIRPGETAYRALHLGDVLAVSASGFTTPGEFYDVTSLRHGTLVGQVLHDDFKALNFAYAASLPGQDKLTISVGEQSATVRLVVQP